MLPYLAEEWGNPSSSYRFGATLMGLIEVARVNKICQNHELTPFRLYFSIHFIIINNFDQL